MLYTGDVQDINTVSAQLRRDAREVTVDAEADRARLGFGPSVLCMTDKCWGASNGPLSPGPGGPYGDP